MYGKFQLTILGYYAVDATGIGIFDALELRVGVETEVICTKLLNRARATGQLSVHSLFMEALLVYMPVWVSPNQSL